ncbi:motility associated factor glycosyltransferase family protein [Campylobacter californiensis]|uniref:motility associated factor glycosyltransferase family protein n=1 Tax=Campylobacter californiensis TaxID=1032243 RepID=UPI001474AECC|nr:6-hydroxymethylpterin diphosphokinase MptE-like protein [Campylobacter sp. RM12916]MBE3609693.1 motility associated factor glycosyltransferase family protein [Campylobacter sp. RM12916]
MANKTKNFTLKNPRINTLKTSQKEQMSEQDISNPIFKKNLQALFQQDEVLAARLWAMTEQDKYEIFIGKDPIDINLIDRQTFEYIYEKPVSDINNMLQEIENQYKRYPILYFYGLGNGILYKALLFNPTHKRIVVLEPEIEIIYSVLNLVDLSEELASQRLTLFYSKFATYTQLYYIVAKNEFLMYAKTYTLQIHTHFYDKFEEDIIRINKEFSKAISQTVVSQGNSIDDMLTGISYHVKNLPTMITNYAYADLIKKRHKLMDTAVIVSTGPSLDKQLDTLKKFAPYVTVISLDASYPILLKHGIKPDYVTSIERVSATSTFFEHKNKKIDEDIYFIVASLTHEQTIKNILPRRLVLTMRPHPTERAFKLDKYGYVGVGHSTANQAYQIAYALGHKNIVLIGQDLAFAPDGKSHATGHAFAQADEFLYVPAYGGKGEVRTTYIWDKFKNQFEADITQSMLNDIKSYNCTEGGARIEGAIERPFLEVMSELCEGKKPKMLPNITKPSEAKINAALIKAYSFLTKKVKVLSSTQDKIEKLFLSIVPQIDKITKLKEGGKISEDMFPQLINISDKIDKIKNLLTKKSVGRYSDAIITMSVYFQELELAKISVAPSDTALEKTKKLIDWVEIHKYWLFSAAGGLNADIQTTQKASENLVKELKKRGLITKNEIGKPKDIFRFSKEDL